MELVSDTDRRIIREIILGFFELFEKGAFTRQHVYDVAMADRDMPMIDSGLSVIFQEFEGLLSEGKIVLVAGEGVMAKFGLRPSYAHRR